MKTLAALVLLVLLAACAQPMDRSHWMQTPQSEKVLYVRALMGGEKAQAAKGGNERVYSRPAEEYVRRIDESYARGDQRDVNAVFAGMAEGR